METTNKTVADILAEAGASTTAVGVESFPHDAALREIVKLRGIVVRMARADDSSAELEAAKAQAANAIADLEQYKGKVRDQAIQVRKDNDWCLSGLNDVLENLGLERYAPAWRVPVTVESVFYIQADSQEEAESIAQGAVDGVAHSGYSQVTDTYTEDTQIGDAEPDEDND